MKRRKMYVCLCLMIVALISVVNQSAMSGEPRTRLEARLSSTGADPLASGKVRSETRGSRVKFNVDVQDIASVGEGGTLNVFVNGASAGSLTVDALGGGTIDLDTDEGDTGVPGPYNNGDIVEVRLSNGTVILTGAFSLK